MRGTVRLLPRASIRRVGPACSREADVARLVVDDPCEHDVIRAIYKAQTYHLISERVAAVRGAPPELKG